MDLKGKKIAVGLSGGVDSSVAALLLKQAGYDVFALFMQNWHDTTGTLHGDCEWEEDLSVAKMVAKKIGIPFHFVDLSGEYRQRVVDYMFSEYEKGRTPNPDVLCNSEIKFDAFLKHAQKLGADYVATGHYCQRELLRNDSDELVFGENGEPISRIIAGTDPNKDQTYFLCQLTQKQLSKALFPIGDILKPRVRELAREAGLPSAEKKDSQGICFVGKVDLPVFLQQKLKPKTGEVVEIFKEFYEGLEDYPAYGNYTEDLTYASVCAIEDDQDMDRTLLQLTKLFDYSAADGKVIGKHQGAQYYTIGQRKGLNIGGHIEPIFIISIDIEKNIIFVGESDRHSGLLRKALHIQSPEVHWIREDLRMKEGEKREYLVRIRYRQPLQKATLIQRKDYLYIVFENAQKSVTPGQFAVWYDESGEMIGSGVIS